MNRLDLIQADEVRSARGPRVRGLEVSGMILSVGASVLEAKADEVFALVEGGGYAEMVAVDERCVFPAVSH